MDPHRRTTRTLALGCVVVTSVAALYAVVGAITAWEPSWGFVLQAVIHLGELAGVLALALSAGAGHAWVGRVGIVAAIISQVLLAAAELIYPASPDIGDPLFSVGPLLTAIGMALAGIAVLRAHRWSGWHRFTPLLIGGWTVVVLIPAIIASGGPPAPLALWAITGWELCWVLLGVAVLGETAVAARGRRTTVPAG